MSLFKTEMTASDASELLMGDYSEYTIQSKFPNTIDGLKPVHRRILLTLHEHYQGGTPKEATVAGRVMEMHPHGDASISDAIAGLAKPYGNIMPLVESMSNLGTYDGEDPGAPRYVEVSPAETAEDLFFRGTDARTLRMVPCESESGMEPANFVPVIPTALIFPVLGIGCGFKTETSAISVANLCKATKKFIEAKYVTHKDDYMKHLSSLAPYLLPDFPVYCTLRNSDAIIRAYRKYNFDQPFVIDGVMKLTKDSFTVTTLPPPFGAFGKTMHDAGEKTQRDKGSWFHEHFIEMKDLGGKKVGALKGNYYCMLRRGENPFELLTMFRKLIQFTTCWKPTRLHHDIEDGLTAETPLTLLDKWSERRYQVVLGGLKQRLKTLFDEYRKVKALLLVVDHAMEIAEIFNSSKDPDATVQVLMKRFGELTAYQAKFLQNLPMKRLTAQGKKELQDQLDDIKRENAELQKKFTRIHEEMLKQVEFIENKYAKEYPAKCVVPNYIGTACYKDTGWIMLETIDEVDQVLQDFNSADLKFDLSQGIGQYIAVGSDDPTQTPDVDVPKYLHASYVGDIGTSVEYLGVFTKDGASFVRPPKMIGLYDMPIVPVGKRCTIITKDGRQIIEIGAKHTRQSIKTETPAIKDVLSISPIDDEEVVVVHCNSRVPSTINIDRIKGNGKISRVPIGKTIVIGVYKVGQPCMFSIPEDVAVRTAVKHMYFKDLGQFVKPNSTLKLFLTKKRDSLERSIVTRTRKSQLYTIEG